MEKWMSNSVKNQLALILDCEKSETVINEVHSIFFFSYRLESFEVIEKVFNQVCSLFEGNFEGYRRCNTEYHNLKHTTDAFLATARLIDGRNISAGFYSESKAVNLLLAALLHDTGYIQDCSDTEGTGAKYTATHVNRSIEFTEKNASRLALSDVQVAEISSFIACTGLNTDFISTLSGEEYTGGSILGTADLIGQMSDSAYLEKLLLLYYEFNEAHMKGYDTTFDMLRQTLSFYESTLNRLDNVLLKSYDFARFHFKKRFDIDENLYMTAIEKQMNYLKTIIADNSSNFRNKLKRLDIEGIDALHKSDPYNKFKIH